MVIRGGHVLSVFTGEVFRADVAIVDGHIVGVGEYEGPDFFDASDKYIVPGFVDAHCHIESSKLNVDEFARMLLRSGTTSVVVDPHEIANVLGTAGVEYILGASKGLPLGVYVKMPSCVPASPFESADEPLLACDFAELLERQRVVGIAEMMNYPAAIAGQPEVMDKMAMADYSNIDGHAPGVTGRALNAYLVAGPSSDHECTTVEEALEKKRLGMWILIREASMIRNLVDLLPIALEYGAESCAFCTDDREAGTLLHEGHMNSIVRKAVAHGMSAADAVKLASLHPARYHGLGRLGAVAPGYRADLLVVPDLERFTPDAVFKDGRIVAEKGTTLAFPSAPVPASVMNTVRVKPVTAGDFRIPDASYQEIRVVELIPDQVVTKASACRPLSVDGQLVASPEADITKLAVVERHHATGRVGLGFVRGFDLQRGAFASTVAHDAHNIVVAGMNDRDMAACVERLAQIGGGLVVVDEGRVAGDLPLEIAGLMSRLPAEEVADRVMHLERELEKMGVRTGTPFMYLSFLALSVIPELRVTDQGIVDVRSFELVPIGVK